MLIGLAGNPSPFKTSMLGYIVTKGFTAFIFNGSNVPTDGNNYVTDIIGTSEERLALKDRGAALILAGKSGFEGIAFDLSINPETEEEKTFELLNQFILTFLRSRHRPDWDEYFVQIAQVAAARSNCLKRQVGAVIVKEQRIVSTGYNGTVRGTKNCSEGGCPRCSGLAASGTNLDTCLCSHGEENAIVTAAYHGISVKDGTIYTTHFPCLMCSKMIINSGIVEVVYTSDYPLNDISFRLFEETGVRIRQYRLIST